MMHCEWQRLCGIVLLQLLLMWSGVAGFKMADPPGGISNARCMRNVCVSAQ